MKERKRVVVVERTGIVRWRRSQRWRVPVGDDVVGATREDASGVRWMC